MNAVECPYCGHDFDYCNDEGFEQDSTWQEECPACGKVFMLTGYYVEHYSEAKADCLNGLAEHDYRPSTPTRPSRCKVCDELNPIKSELKMKLCPACRDCGHCRKFASPNTKDWKCGCVAGKDLEFDESGLNTPDLCGFCIAPMRRLKYE